MIMNNEGHCYIQTLNPISMRYSECSSSSEFKCNLRTILFPSPSPPIATTTSMASPAPSPVPLLAPLGGPIGEAVYSDLAAAKAALQAHAGGNGYAISVESSTERRAFYKCSKRGKYNAKCKDPSVHPSRQRPNTSTMKTDCLYQAVARKVDDGVGYMLKVLDNNYNHRLVEALSAFPEHRIAAMALECA
jgi:hypothetical protein